MWSGLMSRIQLLGGEFFEKASFRGGKADIIVGRVPQHRGHHRHKSPPGNAKNGCSMVKVCGPAASRDKNHGRT